MRNINFYSYMYAVSLTLKIITNDLLPTSRNLDDEGSTMMVSENRTSVLSVVSVTASPGRNQLYLPQI